MEDGGKEGNKINKEKYRGKRGKEENRRMRVKKQGMERWSDSIWERIELLGVAGAVSDILHCKLYTVHCTHLTSIHFKLYTIHGILYNSM